MTRKYRKWTHKTDTSPVRRFRFTENEWRLILDSVKHYVEHLVQVEAPPLKRINQDLVNFYNSDTEQGQKWREASDKLMELRKKVAMLNRIERQLLLNFKLIEAWMPLHAYTYIQRRII